MVTFSRKGSFWLAVKHGSVVALIRPARADENSEWGNVILEHRGGRFDRHHFVVDAKADARKL